MDVDLVIAAAILATRAHHGQRDKAGRNYVLHPARVASRLDDPAAKAVALLHDVVEDTALGLDDLRHAGFPEEVITAVDLLTRKPGQAPLDYYAGIRANPLALAVKAADIADNSDPERLSHLDPETQRWLRYKYANARTVLGLA